MKKKKKKKKNKKNNFSSKPKKRNKLSFSDDGFGFFCSVLKKFETKRFKNSTIDFSTKKTRKSSLLLLLCCARKRTRENASIQSSCLLHQNHHLMLFASLMPPTRPRLSSDTPQASPSRKSFSLLQISKMIRTLLLLLLCTWRRAGTMGTWSFAT